MGVDVVIVGAGFSGIAAGIRLAHFGKRVCIVERHTRIGGLNSYYRRGGIELDTGLHAMTNIGHGRRRGTPLHKLFRQLRLEVADIEIREQTQSQIRFPSASLCFTNEFAAFEASVEANFPKAVEPLRKLVTELPGYEALQDNLQPRSARAFLTERLCEPLLVDMLLCPILFYGGAQPDDMDLVRFGILFRSVFVEGLGRPGKGIRPLLMMLRDRYLACDGALRLGSGVARILIREGRVAGVELDGGEVIHAPVVFSSAGLVETRALCEPALPEIGPVPAGEMAFVESIFVLDTQPRSLGEEHSIVFFSTQDELAYRPPEALVDDRSGLLCLPDNFAGESSEHEQGTVRLSRLASPRRWGGLDPVAYQQAKAVALAEQQDSLCHWLPGVRPHVTMTDFFTPRTVERFTGHRNGAIYGSPVKIPSGSLPAKGLFLCGTDQGLHGIVGAMISGATMANMHVLRAGI